MCSGRNRCTSWATEGAVTANLVTRVHAWRIVRIPGSDLSVPAVVTQSGVGIHRPVAIGRSEQIGRMAAISTIATATALIEQQCRTTGLPTLWIARDTEVRQEHRKPGKRQPNAGTINIKADRRGCRLAQAHDRDGQKAAHENPFHHHPPWGEVHHAVRAQRLAATD